MTLRRGLPQGSVTIDDGPHIYYIPRSLVREIYIGECRDISYRDRKTDEAALYIRMETPLEFVGSLEVVVAILESIISEDVDVIWEFTEGVWRRTPEC